MKKLFLIFALFILACGQQAMPPSSTTGADVTVNVIDSSAEPVPDATVPPGEQREFAVTAKMFEFVPSTLTVKKGDRVKLTVAVPADDTDHGLAIRDYGINVKVAPGESQVVEFVADKTGTFDMFCSVPCGSGHREMRGKLIVE